MSRRTPPRPNYQEHCRTLDIDRLAEYEQFCETVAPLLRQAVKEGWNAEKLKADPRLKTLLEARLYSIALTEKDAAKALAAIKDIKDRTEGKPVERRELRATLEAAPDEQLDARLKTLLGDAAEDAAPDDSTPAGSEDLPH